jgi:AcrR family transcriptional regulator
MSQPAFKETSKPRRRRGSLNREQILEAALSIVHDEGLDQLSMRPIAARLGCSVASLYTHFRNREAIIRELLLIGEERLTEKLKQALVGQSDTFEELEALALAYWDFAHENHSLLKLMLHQDSRAIQKTLSPLIPSSYKVFLLTIRKGVQSGEIHYPPKSYTSIARTIWAWIYGLIVMDLNGMGRNKNAPHPVEEGIYFWKIMLRRGPGPLENIRNMNSKFMDAWQARLQNFQGK